MMSMLDIPGYRYDTERSFSIRERFLRIFFRFCQPKRVPAPNITGENRPGSGGPSTLSLSSFVNIGRGQVLDDRSAADLSSTVQHSAAFPNEFRIRGQDHHSIQ